MDSSPSLGRQLALGARAQAIRVVLALRCYGLSGFMGCGHIIIEFVQGFGAFFSDKGIGSGGGCNGGSRHSARHWAFILWSLHTSLIFFN